MKRISGCIKECTNAYLAEIVQIAGKAALKAGSVLRDLYDKPHQIKHKGEIDLVTEADVAAEKIILDILASENPPIGIMSEESSTLGESVPAGPLWIIDPLDGTTNYAHGFPWFGVSIAYAEEGIPMAGVIYSPVQDELFCATTGGGAWLNGKTIRVSTEDSLGDSLMATGFPYTIRQDSTKVIGALEAVLTRCQGVRRAGAAALDLAYVACGRLDGFWEITLKPWDTAAGKIIVEEAGGRLSDFSGKPFNPFLSEVVATNGSIHNELTRILEQFR